MSDAALIVLSDLDGTLLNDATNHFVDLHSVLANEAANAGLRAYERDDLNAGRAHGRAPSRWIVP